jgi:hypothetical protein
MGFEGWTKGSNILRESYGWDMKYLSPKAHALKGWSLAGGCFEMFWKLLEAIPAWRK